MRYYLYVVYSHYFCCQCEYLTFLNVKSQQLGSITQIAFSRLQAKRCGSNLDLDQSTAFSTASACSPLLAFCTMRGQESAARERLYFSCARVLN